MADMDCALIRSGQSTTIKVTERACSILTELIVSGEGSHNGERGKPGSASIGEGQVHGQLSKTW